MNTWIIKDMNYRNGDEVSHMNIKMTIATSQDTTYGI